MLKSRMLGKPLVRFCEGRGGNRTLSEFPKHPVYSTSHWRFKARLSENLTSFHIKMTSPNSQL